MNATQLRPDTRSSALVSRWFAHPIDSVFEAWIFPSSIAAWWGPIGYGATVLCVEARQGGRFEVEMTSPEGEIALMKGTIVEFDRPYRMAIQFFEHCNTGLPPGVPPQLEAALMEIELTQERGGTQLRLWHAPLGKGFSDLAGVVWGQSLEKLASTLEAAS